MLPPNRVNTCLPAGIASRWEADTVKAFERISVVDVFKMKKDKIDQFLNKVTNWASAQPDILALALIGSYARDAATDTSDVDLVLISTNPKQYLQDPGWVHQFGVVEKQQVEYYGLLTSIRVWYTDGREVEYGITDGRWSAIPLDEGSQRVISDGMLVLFEQNHILSRHQ
jgi:hypothetical protein